MSNEQFVSQFSPKRWHKIIFMLVSTVFFVFSAFGETNCTINGEVFIVTQGADNIRLGLVEVKVFTEGDITNYIAERLKQAPSEMPKYDELVEATEKSIQETKTNTEALKKVLADYSQKAGDDFTKNSQEGIKLSESTLATLEGVKEELLDRKRNWPDAEYFFKALPKAEYSALTDADGKFEISLPRNGKFAIAAQASRQIFVKSTENYFWLIWVSLDGQSGKKILLSNHNQVTSNAKESVISTKF